MVFPSSASAEMPVVGAGVCTVPEKSIILTSTDGRVPFEDGLIIGRVAQIKAGVLSNMDATPTPVIAGVVMRQPNRPVDEDMIYSKQMTDNVNFVRSGMVTVEGTGTAPDYLKPVYCNTDGVATKSNSDTALNAEFIEEIQTGVWLIRFF